MTESTLDRVCRVYGQRGVAARIGISREEVNRWATGRQRVGADKLEKLAALLPRRPGHWETPKFTFVDLFAGIGGLRKPFEDLGGKCVFTCEWDSQAQRTYEANFYLDHPIHGDIKELTTSPEKIRESIPEHDLLVAGFPCQPFSIAGVSKKNSLGRSHGFDCEIQGTLFFDLVKVIEAHQPKAFLLENVKNLKSHDKGRTYLTIMRWLREELGYIVPEPIILDARHWLPQHRERIVMVGFREECGFSWDRLRVPSRRPTLNDILEPEESVDSKYVLSDLLWKYLQGYKAKHQSQGNGFGFGKVFRQERGQVTRTLSARYYKDGSEILVDRDDENPRRLTPRECARLMGFDRPGESDFVIPVSDTQAYKQFGNSVAVPAFRAVARLMKDHLLELVSNETEPEPQQRLPLVVNG